MIANVLARSSPLRHNQVNLVPSRACRLCDIGIYRPNKLVFFRLSLES